MFAMFPQIKKLAEKDTITKTNGNFYLCSMETRQAILRKIFNLFVATRFFGKLATVEYGFCGKKI